VIKVKSVSRKIYIFTHITHITMVNITLAVPQELKSKMEEFPEINWSEVARQAIKERAMKLAIFKSITEESKLTEKDVLALGRKVNEALHERYKKLYPKELK